MVIRRSLLLGFAAVVVCSTSLLAQSGDQPRKLTNAEKKEFQTAMKMVDDAAAGQPLPNDLSLAWMGMDLFKAQDNKQYLPFSVTVDTSKVAGDRVTLYWRVIAKNPPAADPKAKKKKADEYAYEALTTAQVKNRGAATRFDRSFTVEPGEYDVFVLAKETAPDKAPKNAPPQKVSVIKQTVNVADLWNGELSTSSVLVFDRVDPLAAPLTPEQQLERPYALGAVEYIPAPTTKLTKAGSISTFLLIYNTKTDAANKPDVSVEYNFYTKSGGAETFFNKTTPFSMNAQTLPPEFDFAAGHQLQSEQSVPLASFPAGDYRLEIKITDKLGNKTLTRDVAFSVSGS